MFRATLLALVASAAAFKLPATPPKVEHAKSAACAAALSALLIASPVSAGTQEAAVALADAAYPLVGSLQSKTVGPLAGKVVSLGLSGNPKEIIKAIDMVRLLWLSRTLFFS